jgi:hypothetical protein
VYLPRQGGDDLKGHKIPEAAITRTESGVRIDLKTIYAYPDGHFNIIFADGTNQPLNDSLEAVAWFADNVLRSAQRRAVKEHK